MVETTALPQTNTEASVRSEVYAARHHAPFSLRCGALLIDYIVPMAIIAFSTLLARMLGGGARLAGSTTQTVGVFIALGVTALNFVVLAGVRGQTLGKWATGLRIEQQDGKPLSFLTTLVRHLVGYPLSLLTLGIGFLISVFNPQGRALHDMIAGTVVVLDRERRPRPAR